MKIIDCIQGSPEWMRARLGKPTASKFGEIISPTGKATSGKARKSYQLELVGERICKSPQPHFVTPAMMRGTELESDARSWFVRESFVKVEKVGFCLSDCGRWGCSPDGLTEEGGIEIKCPGRVNFLAMLEDKTPEPNYIMQIQGCMFVTGRTEWEFILYSDDPGMPNTWWTIKRDDKLQEALARALPIFCDEVDELEEKIRGNINA